MGSTLAFDVYGTLIDTAGVVATLREYLGNEAPRFSDAWRQKQLEYSFRRAAMGAYQNFSVCTSEALEYTSALFGLKLDSKQHDRLVATYRILPAFHEVRGALDLLGATGYRLFAFSNGLPGDLESLLAHSDISDCFIDIVSVDEIRSFKPDPAVYRHMLDRVESTPEKTWLISSNPFDILGAANVGLSTAWVRRHPGIPFDPWGKQPTATISSLAHLVEALKTV